MTPPPMPADQRRLSLLLAAMQFTHLLDYMVLMPLGAEVMRVFSVDAASFGWLVGVYTLASASAALFGAAALDRYDRRHVLLVLYAGFIVATLACAAAPSFNALLLARAIAGACAGLMTATVMALIGDRIEPARRGQAVGMVMSAFGASAVAGVPLGLWLASMAGWRAPFVFVAALALVCWLLLARLLPSTRTAPGTRVGIGAIFAQPGLALGWLLTFGIVFSGFLIVPYIGAFLGGTLAIAVADLSWFYLCAGAATFVSARFIGQAADRFGPVRVLALLMIASIAPHLAFTHLTPSPLPLVAAIFVAFMVLTSSRAIPALAFLINRVPPPLRGRYMSINMACSDAASGLAAATSGLIVGSQPEAFGNFGVIGWVATGVTLSTLALLWKLQQPRRMEAAAVS